MRVVDLFERAARILPKVAAGAAERERLRVLPHEQIRQLANAQLFTFRIPRGHGGAGSTVREVIRFVIDLAAADSNIAQALRPDFSFIEGLRANGTDDERELWFGRFLGGAVVGNAGWEIGGANGAISARISRAGDHFTAKGSKYYSTGSLYADWVSATALDDDDQPVSFIVPRDREGLELVDDFDGMGQRLTASGTTNLHDMTVFAHEIRHRAISRDRRSPVTPFLQLYLGAVQAGIARNALADAVAFARERARPIRHSSAERSVDDPYVQLAVGEISARAFAAESVILAAASTIDEVWAADFDNDLLTTASVTVAQAQFLAAEAALRASELVFDVGGGSATAREHNLDRHWRNARTVANHNPRLWKAAVVGAYRLTGAEPPTSGLF
ncbi:alkylation response protein AidB-like acyl-CoA dehydrogenase [Allocatelliglobosispora scoriae]|uniref:Alkylation response protein AidB-like acyl-CoA dehydrogenase n=1 Tax=Allocatelliglobosispora scoriae TaxID=643052 RepID=A0A841BN26_9ACTN|nr:acyl-CoA dehydrogenase family protein [Allocatelliglobosispora scoriae]MBB5868220.1 alkylation response protein AidB-like acyl-CoA dehydrogenase [Allocatelliglobosispora scoriae]